MTFCLMPLARGGATEVFAGTRPGVRSPEILCKSLRPRFARNPRVRFRFARECELLGRVEHPALPAVVTARPHVRDGAFVCYRYVDGAPLSQHLRELSAADRKRREELAECVLAGVLPALCYLHAHRDRIAHGDVAPRNIIVGGARTSLIDLGTAKTTSMPPHPDDLFAVGQPAYLSPEQAQGEEWGCASDAYQLGLTLFEVLTGRRYNTGTNLRDCRLLAAGAVPPVTTDWCVDPRYTAVVAALLAPNPSARLPLRDLEP